MHEKKIYAYQSTEIKSKVDEISKVFKSNLKWYECFFKEFLLENIKSSILDIPCGHGNILYFLKSKGFENVKGYDIDPGRVEMANQLGLNAEIGDGISIIKNKRNIDIIFSLDFLEHLDKDIVIKYLEDCNNALRNGGMLIVRMPISDNILGAYDFFNDFTHKWTAHSHVIESLFKIAGFQKVIIKDERPLLYKPTNYIRFLATWLIMGFHNLRLKLIGLPQIKIWSRSVYFIAYK